jgi:hypothetical protein
MCELLLHQLLLLLPDPSAQYLFTTECIPGMVFRKLDKLERGATATMQRRTNVAAVNCEVINQLGAVLGIFPATLHKELHRLVLGFTTREIKELARPGKPESVKSVGALLQGTMLVGVRGWGSGDSTALHVHPVAASSTWQPCVLGTWCA